jgi:hypothetical protein
MIRRTLIFVLLSIPIFFTNCSLLFNNPNYRGDINIKNDNYILGYRDGCNASYKNNLNECMFAGNACMSCVGGIGGAFVVWISGGAGNSGNWVVVGYLMGGIIGGIPLTAGSDLFVRSPDKTIETDSMYVKGYRDGFYHTKRETKRAAIWGGLLGFLWLSIALIPIGIGLSGWQL